ncbi:orotidine-5'-phosphate decarboxylase [Paeniglutamicibacter sp. ANT13_2]|uniref:Orotidine-5'-phosphate decarboxylase n=1 Tax=Paeniglutamicibacter terrestris TaxID=2723403 RepID=A0ABX1G3P3_9MICC|nr:orotidine-5'-phosphate decarboxylase [Paeniglutamicibacter terrestris]NKG20857.1 orotidine-5'-phosphate decarboxylase [Paeniglutamicibacter terrestris]
MPALPRQLPLLPTPRQAHVPSSAVRAAAAASRVPFGERLAAAMNKHGQLCVGIDPHPALLSSWGLNDDVTGLRSFSLTVVEALAGHVAALKPQVALYERHGSRGLAVLEETLALCAQGHVLSIADAKRGDIGSTMAAYADAWLGEGSPLAADAVTLSPYLGYESLRPALDLAAATGRGVFVLGLTSNPEGASVQHVGGSASVAKGVIQSVGAENAGALPFGSTGLVIGATVGSALEKLGINLAASHAPILAPGLGAQGATGADMKASFGAFWPQVLGTSSRDILKAGPTAAALCDAAAATRDSLL